MCFMGNLFGLTLTGVYTLYIVFKGFVSLVLRRVTSSVEINAVEKYYCYLCFILFPAPEETIQSKYSYDFIRYLDYRYQWYK